MFIYYYEKNENHKSADTNKYILKSINDYFEKKNMKPINNVTVFRNLAGKPYVDINNVFIGVTHTDNLLIIALNEKEFGIDCEEKSRIINNKERIMKKYFSKKEQEYAENDKERFLEIWVKKEAYLKFLGTGFADIAKADTYNVSGVFKKIDYKNYIIYVYSK